VLGGGKKLGTTPGEEQCPDEARDERGGDKKRNTLARRLGAALAQQWSSFSIAHGRR
jgi:hypothetical protein